MEKYNNKTNRNWELFKAWLYKELCTINEYKINTYSSLFSSLARTFALFLFLTFFNQEFSSILNFTTKEIIFISLFSQSLNYLGGVWSHSHKLDRILLSGKLNIYLVRPFSVCYQQILFSGKLRRVITFLVPFLILIFYLTTIKINWFKFFIIFLFGVYSSIFAIILYKCIDAVSFFMKDSKFVRDNIMVEIENMYATFPESIFEEGFFKSFAKFIPFAYISSYSTSFLFGKMTYYELFNLSLIVTILIFVFGIILFILWHYGLKKYEAFG